MNAEWERYGELHLRVPPMAMVSHTYRAPSTQSTSSRLSTDRKTEGGATEQ